MLRYIYSTDLLRYEKLGRTMFEDRADQFRTRLGWDVTVDAQGQERDAYDALDPLYVIWERPDGRHGGSMRFLPTTGRVMVNDVFRDLIGGGAICSPQIWECTRFCQSRQNRSPRDAARVAAALMLGGGELMRGFGIRHFVGVFDSRMERIYRMTGSSPVVLGAQGAGRGRISVGLWSYSATDQARIARCAGLSPELSRHWFTRAFGNQPHHSLAQIA